jgi:hypothetical protein
MLLVRILLIELTLIFSIVRWSLLPQNRIWAFKGNFKDNGKKAVVEPLQEPSVL